MSKVLVIGANGKVGRILVAQLAQSEHTIVAMVRDQKQAKFDQNVVVVEANLEEDIRHAIQGCDYVIFTAGSGANTGFDKTLLVDLWGACKAIDTANDLKVSQFIMVSSRGASNPDLGPTAIKPYCVAKHFADKHLEQSGLNYTILRPGRLTDDTGTGLITTNRPGDASAQWITREDTASVVQHCLNNPAVINKTYELYAGESPISTVIS